MLSQLGIYSGVDKEPPPLCLADARLGVGSTGPSVKCLQDKLIKDGYMQDKSTGTFDKPTSEAVRAFQLATPPLETDGSAGPSTLAAMGIWSGKTTQQGSGQAAAASRPGGPWPAGSRAVPQLEPHPRRDPVLRQSRRLHEGQRRHHRQRVRQGRRRRRHPAVLHLHRLA